MALQVTEHHLAVTRTARFCLLGDFGEETSELWVVCHGFGQLAREFLAAFTPIVSPRRVVAAPEALSRFYKSQGTVHTPDTPVGATWMTSEDREHEMADYVGYLDVLLADLRRRASANVTVTALGFSQGAATVSRWVARSQPVVDRVILWGGFLPPELRKPETIGGLARQPLDIVVGRSDRYFSSDFVDAEYRVMQALGVPVSLIQFDGGHIIDSATLNRLAASTDL